MQFRTILMTSFAFILGVVPLVILRGTGPSGRNFLGSTVLGEMITSSFLAVLFEFPSQCAGHVRRSRVGRAGCAASVDAPERAAAVSGSATPTPLLWDS